MRRIYIECFDIKTYINEEETSCRQQLDISNFKWKGQNPNESKHKMF